MARQLELDELLSGAPEPTPRGPKPSPKTRPKPPPSPKMKAKPPSPMGKSSPTTQPLSPGGIYKKPTIISSNGSSSAGTSLPLAAARRSESKRPAHPSVVGQQQVNLIAEMKKNLAMSASKGGVRAAPQPKVRQFERDFKSHRRKKSVHRQMQPLEVPDRNPPLQLVIGERVTVISEDRGNISWRECKLLHVDESTGQCTIEGSDGRPQFARRKQVKPEGYIAAMESLFSITGSETEMDFRPFQIFLQCLGCKYDYASAHFLFRSLDTKSTGSVQFLSWLGWVYGSSNVPDNGRLLNLLECICGIRSWDPSLQFQVMGLLPTRSDPTVKKLQWCIAKMSPDSIAGANDDRKSTVNNVILKVVSNEATIKVPKHIKQFASRFRTDLSELLKTSQPKFRPVMGTAGSATSSGDIAETEEMSIVVMGAASVGKSSLIARFVRRAFLHDYVPTTEDEFRKQISVDGSNIQLNILDTAGQAEFVGLRYDWLREDRVDLLMVCFQRSDFHSFYVFQEQLIIAKKLLFQSRKPRKVPILAVCTKSDEQANFAVTQDDIDQVLSAHGGESQIRYVECSAFVGENIAETFEEAVRMFREWKKTGGALKSEMDPSSPVGRNNSLITNAQTERFAFDQSAIVIDSSGKTHDNGSIWDNQCCNLCFSTLGFCAQNDSAKPKRRNLPNVPMDQYPTDISPPVFSVMHFDIYRQFVFPRFLATLLVCLLFPIILMVQTLVFVFYSDSCKCCWQSLPQVDYTDPKVGVWFDYLSFLVGREESDQNITDDIRKWFLYQNLPQRLARLVLCPLILVLYGVSLYIAWRESVERTSLTDYDNDSDKFQLSLIEYIFPLQLWAVFWFILALYSSIEINVSPEMPSDQSLRPFVMYFGADESLRTTVYAFIKAGRHSNDRNSLDFRQLHATWDRVLVSFVIGLFYALIPGLTRVGSSRPFFTANQEWKAVWGLIVNFWLIFVMALVLQMQLMSGTRNYGDWMEDVTSMLDEDLAHERGVEYLGFERQSNALAWIELRSYLYSKGINLMSRQEMFIGFTVLLGYMLSTYVLYRGITEFSNSDGDQWKSETYNGIRLGALFLAWILIRFMKESYRVHNLQLKQLALLHTQKMKIYYERVTMAGDGSAGDHRPGHESAFSEMFDNLPSLDIVMNSQSRSSDRISGNNSGIPLAALRSAIGITEDNLKRSENLIDHIIGTVTVQSLSAKVFGIRLTDFVGFGILAIVVAVLPTLIKTMTNDVCRGIDFSSNDDSADETTLATSMTDLPSMMTTTTTTLFPSATPTLSPV